MIIKTQKGPKSPNDAFAWLKHPDCSVPNKISILGLLAELAPFFGHEAAAWIKEQSALKGENKLLRTAEGVLTGLPLGEKRFTEEAGFLKYLKALPQGSRVHLTIGSNKIGQLRELLSLNGKYLDFDAKDVMFLRECVIASGRWESITRTYNVQIFATTGASVEVLAHAMSLCIESIELVHTLQQLQQALGEKTPMQKTLEGLLAKYTDVEYDPELFLQTVSGLEYFDAKSWMSELGQVEPMVNVLERFRSDYGRLEFFKAYALQFEILMRS
jgi:hypothetical protein